MTSDAKAGIRVLDWAISDRVENPDDLARARVVVGAAQWYLLTAVAMVLAGPSLDLPLVGSLLFALCGASYVVVLYAVKRHAAVGMGALLLAGTITALMVCMALQPNGADIAMSLWTAAIPLLVTYAADARTGLYVAFGLVPILVGTWTAQYYGFTLDSMAWPEPTPPTVASNIVALPVLAGIGALHRVARDRAQHALEETVDALTAQERLLVSVIETSGELVFSVDRDLCLVHVNSRARAQLGRIRPLELGESYLRYVEPDQVEAWRERFACASAQGKLRLEDRIIGADGVECWLDISIQPITGDGCEGFTVSAQDITRRKRDEAELVSLHRKLVDASRRAGKADVAVTVLHNIGNVLSSADVATTQLSEIVERGPDRDVSRLRDLLPSERDELVAFFRDDPRAEHVHPFLCELAAAVEEDGASARAELGLLHRAIGHIRAIVRDQQDVARTGSVLETCHPKELLDTAVRLSSGMDYGTRVETRCDDELAPFESDRHKVIQILANLLVNARHAVKDRDGGTIRLEIGHDDDHVTFTVIDNGIGIDSEGLTRVFQHGYTTKPDGHGFGLHSAGNDAADLGGRLEAHSDGLGRGARFILTIPMTPPQRLRERFQEACA